MLGVWGIVSCVCVCEREREVVGSTHVIIHTCIQTDIHEHCTGKSLWSWAPTTLPRSRTRSSACVLARNSLRTLARVCAWCASERGGVCVRAVEYDCPVCAMLVCVCEGMCGAYMYVCM